MKEHGPHINCTRTKMNLYFFPNSMESDRGNSSPYEFEPNGIQFRSKSKGKLLLGSYSIQFEKKIYFYYCIQELPWFFSSTQ